MEQIQVRTNDRKEMISELMNQYQSDDERARHKVIEGAIGESNILDIDAVDSLIDDIIRKGNRKAVKHSLFSGCE